MMTKANELRTKGKEELMSILREGKESLRALSFDAHLGSLKNVKSINKQKKLVARVLTVLKEKK